MINNTILRVNGICKDFPGVRALNDVSFELKKGEIHAIVGENGAGKSTLMKILGGVYKEDKGDIYINETMVDISNPRKSLQLGIAIVYQELNLVPPLNVVENLYIGEELVKPSTHLLDKRKMIEETNLILNSLGHRNIDINDKVRNLTIAQQQIVEIAKAIRLNTRILILDEPTAILGQEDTNVLFRILRELKEKGVSIIYISHRLDEIFELCDRVTVMRDGNYIDTLSHESQKFNKNDLIKLMCGRELCRIFNRQSVVDELGSDDYVLEIEDLTNKEKFYNITFNLKRGEVLGFSGLVGAGRTDLFKAIFGLVKIDSGSIRINGNVTRIRKVHDAMSRKIGFVPEDRKREGLLLNESMKENLILPNLKIFSKFGFVDRKKQKRVALDYIDSMNIKPRYIDRKAIHFSGGNQQKIVLSKWLLNKPQIMIFDEPTRGIDVGAKQEIYNLISKLTVEGISVVLISSEMEEILGMSDRIIVMHEGRITGEFSRSEATQELLLQKASGI